MLLICTPIVLGSSSPISGPSNPDIGERVVTPKKVMSVGAQHALKDMVELQMYLLAQPQQTPWPMLPRTTRTLPEGQKPYCNPVESSAANELIDRGFIEQSSK